MQSAENVTLLFPARTAGGLPPDLPPAAPFTRAAATEIGIAGLARRFGIADRTTRTIIRTIRLMIETRGFPPPKTPRFVKGEPRTGSDAVHAGSRWDRDLVDDWFDRDLPPGGAAANAIYRRELTRADLAARAQALVA